MSAQPRDFRFTAQELAEFHRNGYAGPFTLYEPDEIEWEWARARQDLADRSDAVYRDESDGTGAGNSANYDRHLDNAFLADHITQPGIVDRVASVLGPDVLCWRSDFFPKYPGNEGTDWHQAATFANASGRPQIQWPRDCDPGGCLTVWCAFTDATADMGGLQFIPGTHRTMYYDETKPMRYDPERNISVVKNGVRRGFFGYDYRELQIDPDWQPDESKAVSVEMRAGQFVIFWSRLLHASHPHAGRTNRMRMAFSARYVPTSVRVYPGASAVEEYGGRASLERYGTVLVSGVETYGHNRVVQHTTKGHPFRRRTGDGAWA
ncbi:chlorinating enzyme [Streptomyces rubradiris]|uniref:Chemotaxis protein CheX n=1 Tax=Streptomyces rubradiris TaxID=285531 RepID=A0ABQ3RQZ7_STRRR|nr:chlorinating enzyme [Streptomyces rubradiris]GHH24621.1 chemotaxis protein CheX [Streptomyces rubradiris]GHI58279.1 chemotaxis protein CheX [Streptomyces rubradiris]